METLTETRRMNTFTYRVPAGSQSAFLRTMAKNMGWEQVKTRQPRKRKTEPRYPALDRAIEDVRAGRVYSYDSVEEMWEHLNEPDDFTPNACTIRAIEEAEAGKTHKAASAEDLIQQILG